MPRPDKVSAVAEIADAFRTSNAAVLTEYRGLSVKELTQLRRALGAGTSFAIVKNTLTKRLMSTAPAITTSTILRACAMGAKASVVLCSISNASCKSSSQV